MVAEATSLAQSPRTMATALTVVVSRIENLTRDGLSAVGVVPSVVQWIVASGSSHVIITVCVDLPNSVPSGGVITGTPGRYS